jgi:hypothetical protein
VLALGIGLLGGSLAFAQDPVQCFDAEVMPASRSSRRGRMEIQITRWSTAEEKANLSVLMQLEDSKAFVGSLEKLEPVGFIRYRSSNPQPLRFARQTVKDGKRTIVLFTDVPLTKARGEIVGSDTTGVGLERIYPRRAPDEGELIEIVELQLNEKGMGEGSWATGVRIGVNPETGLAGILSKESVLRLGKVRPVD